ncbi:MAG: alpha/beta hydrolase [Armatimonadetes bacterium]|nr:alpha/beta hydrolase [Armatimonadota bacterium]
MFSSSHILLCLLTIKAQGFEPAVRFHRPPADCQTIDYTFKSQGLRLAATLYRPAASAPVIVLVAGSNPGGRADDYLQTTAKTFAANGFAALIFDKPGVGNSEGTYVEMPDLRKRALDVQAAVQSLYTVQGFKPQKIGLWGLSQGGWVLPLAANLEKKVSFIITASGPTVSPMEQDIFARSNELRRDGFSEQQIRIISDFSRRNTYYTSTGQGYDQLKKEEAAYEGQAWFERAKNRIVPPLVPPKYLNHPRLAMFKDKNILLYDPRPTLKHLKQPMLAVFGDQDNVVNAPESIAVLKEIRKSDRIKVKILTFHGANHPMLVPGQMKFVDGYFDTILDWATAQAKAR